MRKKRRNTNQPAPSKKAFGKDGLGNIVKGIGGNKDALQNTSFVKTNLDLNHNPHLAEILYLDNWLVGNICDVPAEEATRAWCEITTDKTEDQEKLKNIKTLFNKINLKQKIKSALAFADLFGGCALYAIVNDGRTQDQPLDMKNIRKNSFQKVKVLDPLHITPINNGLDEPEQYQVQNFGKSNLVIHKSRLYIFKGLELTENKSRELRFWGGSKAQRAMQPIIATDTALNAIVNMLTETNVNVYKLEGLTELATDGGDEDAIKKIMLIDKAKSYLNSILLDSKDDLVKSTNDFKDLHQVHGSTLINVAGASRIPATLLFGKSPDGMNATGTYDLENFHKRVNTTQTDKIEPSMNFFTDLASYSENGEPLETSLFWNPLTQETKKEQSERKNKDADTDSKRISSKIFTEKEIRQKEINNNPEFAFLKAKQTEEKAEDEE